MELSGIIVNILKWDFWLKDGIAPVSHTLSLFLPRVSLSPLVFATATVAGHVLAGRALVRPPKLTGPVPK
ncbi:unnamed protein product [Prunus armeniaca]